MGRDTVGLGLEGERAGTGFTARVDEVGETAGSVEGDSEMAREGRTECSGTAIRVDLTEISTSLRLGRNAAAKTHAAHLVVYQPPLLQERMHPHDSAHVTRQIPPAGRHGQILPRVQPIRVDHKVPIVLVYRRRLASIAITEKFWETAAFYRVDGGHAEP